MKTPPYTHKGFKAGDVIAEEMPVIYALRTHRKDCCNGCFRSERHEQHLNGNFKLSECPGCLKVKYCSRKCQLSDWELFHAWECDIFENNENEHLIKSDISRLAIRLIILCLYRPEELTKEHEDLSGRKRRFMDLLSHKDQMRANQVRQSTFMAAVEGLKDLGFEFNENEFEEVFYRENINSFSILDMAHGDTGSGLYIATAMFDHSCSPNASYTFDGIKICVRAMEEIAQNEPICLAYYDVLKDRYWRRTVLERSYFFECECSRCVPHDKEDEKKCQNVANNLFELVHHFSSEAREIEWNEVIKIYEKLIDSIAQIHGHRHPYLSFHKINYYILSVEAGLKPKICAQEILNCIKQTHGPDHLLTKHFNWLSKQLEKIGPQEIAQITKRARLGRYNFLLNSLY